MENKYVYASESMRRLFVIAVIFLVISIPLIALGVYALVEGEWFGYIFFSPVPILWVIVLALYIRTLRVRRRYRDMEHTGKLYEGRVVGFHSQYHKASGHDPRTPSYYTRHLTVEYTDESGVTKQFITPSLAFEPLERAGIKCKVYVKGDDRLAVGFTELQKKPFDFKKSLGELIGYVICCVVLVMIAYLVSQFRN